MKTRIDKWLWAVRIFKTRTLATESCKAGRVKINGKSVKPSYMLQEGEIIIITKNHVQRHLKVLGILEKRVSASIAQECYEDLTPKEEQNKIEGLLWKSFEKRDSGVGRPTKKDRRIIDRLKNK
jgi:ribosome-associated heat shock protein Hsp15